MKSIKSLILMMLLSLILGGCAKEQVPQIVSVGSPEENMNEKGCIYEGLESQCGVLLLYTKNLNSVFQVRSFLVNYNIKINQEEKPMKTWTLFIASKEELVACFNQLKTVAEKVEIDSEKNLLYVSSYFEDEDKTKKIEDIFLSHSAAVRQQSQSQWSHWTWNINVTPDSKLLEVKKQLEKIPGVSVGFNFYIEAF